MTFLVIILFFTWIPDMPAMAFIIFMASALTNFTNKACIVNEHSVKNFPESKIFGRWYYGVTVPLLYFHFWRIHDWVPVYFIVFMTSTMIAYTILLIHSFVPEKPEEKETE